MARFYGTVRGKAVTTATREGNEQSGVTTQAASWSGAIEVYVYKNIDGQDCYTIDKIPWKGVGKYKTISTGKF